MVGLIAAMAVAAGAFLAEVIYLAVTR
jgi:hypothetical protein